MTGFIDKVKQRRWVEAYCHGCKSKHKSGLAKESMMRGQVGLLGFAKYRYKEGKYSSQPLHRSETVSFSLVQQQAILTEQSTFLHLQKYCEKQFCAVPLRLMVLNSDELSTTDIGLGLEVRNCLQWMHASAGKLKLKLSQQRKWR